MSRLFSALEKLSVSYEIIFIDDGSTDRTHEELKEVTMTYENVTFLRHDTNLGIPNAWQTGVNNASKKHVLLMDADMQYAPEDIRLLLKPYEINDPSYIIQGIRSPRYEKPKYRIWMSQIFSLMLKILFRLNLKDIKSGFLICNKEALVEILKFKDHFLYFQHWIIVTANYLGYGIIQVPVPFYSRSQGTSFIRFPLRFIFSALKDIPEALAIFKKRT